MRRRTLARAAIGIVATGALAAGVTVMLDTPAITVAGTLNKAGPCYSLRDTEITPHSTLVVLAHDGEQLAYGNLRNHNLVPKGWWDFEEDRCEFWFRVHAVESGRGPYRLEIGDGWNIVFAEDRSERLNLFVSDGRLVNGY